MTDVSDVEAARPETRPRLPRRTAFVSWVIPPHDSGQAVMLYRLLSGFDPSSYVVISAGPGRGVYRPDGSTTLPSLDAPTVRLDPRGRFPSPGRAVAVLERARRIAAVLRRYRCEAVVGCSGGDVVDLPASYRAASFRRVPFFAYLFDWYLYQHPDSAAFAARAERVVLSNARRSIVTNTSLADEYRARYGIDADVIYNPIPGTEPAGERSWPAVPTGPIRIAYTGQIYDAQADAIRNLTDALDLLEPGSAVLDVYSAQTAREIRRYLLFGPSLVHHGHLPPDEVGEAQRTADILFLPLAFRTPYDEIVRTASPSKLGEYLTSGRPILVHAPAGSFLDRYFAEHGCGVVVNRPDPYALAEAVRTIRSDDALRRRIVRAAAERARADFGLTEARSRLRSVLGS